MAKLVLDDTLLEIIYYTGSVRVSKAALSKQELNDFYEEMKNEKYIIATDEGDVFLLEQGEKWDKVAKHYDDKEK